MNIKLLDGSIIEVEQGTAIIDVAASISKSLAKAACAAKVNGEVVDLRTILTEDCELAILTFNDPEGKHVYWHTSAHIMAQAVKRLFPSVRCAIGPALENGFYYDFDTPQPFTPDDLAAIEKEMEKIIRENIAIERFTLERPEAIAYMQSLNEIYKVQLIEELPEDAVISFYRQGDYTDLCVGPHLMSTGRVRAYKITQVAGAYWKGDQANQQLQRVYGISFTDKKDMDQYFARLEEAKKRDHRKIGKELGLFMITDEGPGFPFFLPKGTVLKNTLIDYWREIHKRYGYVEVSTPMILNRQLWERSGHWGHYKQNMYTTVIDEQDFAIKPMNCPGGMLVYKSEPHSYKELPLRVGELGLVHRHELSGALNGLFRVRCFTQDDAHIFMSWDQMRDEIKRVVTLFDEVYSTFGLPYTIELSTMPDDHMGDEKDWEFAQETLKAAITDMGKTYQVNEGDGAFYGPKLDFHLEDSMGRTWQCGTIQLDMQLPERFELEYTGADGEKHRPVMIHRVVFGSIERFIGVITEHFAGAYPTWLAPVQVKVITIAEKHREYAQSVLDKLNAAGIRAELDDRNEKVGYKIREAQLSKIPYMFVVGDKEAEEGTVAVRSRKEGDKGAILLDDVLENIKGEITSRSL